MKKKFPSDSSHATLVARVSSLIHSHSLLTDGDKAIVAVSGGADSLALLHVLHAVNMQLQLFAVYIDHGLRPDETPSEINTIQHCCRQLQIPFLAKNIAVMEFAHKQKKSIEEASRILRYQALEQLRKEQSAQAIAVGHTADDQVEEFFIRLVRGSSRKSLSGMNLQKEYIIRPLLREHKATLIDYLAEIGISWCLDSSNLEREFLRNRVRLDLIPLLEKDFNPSIQKTILQNMDILTEEESYLEDTTNDAYEKCVTFIPSPKDTTGKEQLTVLNKLLISYHSAIQRRILEKGCWQMKSRPGYEKINALLQLVIEGVNGSEIHLTNGVRVEKSSTRILFSRPLKTGQVRGSKDFASAIAESIPGPGRYNFDEINKELILEEVPISLSKKKTEGMLQVDRDKISFPLLLRSSIPGERFQPLGAPGCKKVSRFFNDRKIPAKERPSNPVLLTGSHIIALPGLQIDQIFRITDRTTTVLTITWNS